MTKLLDCLEIHC